MRAMTMLCEEGASHSIVRRRMENLRPAQICADPAAVPEGFNAIKHEHHFVTLSLSKSNIVVSPAC